MVTIERDGLEASVEKGKWTSKSIMLRSLCELAAIKQPYFPQPSDPDPDWTLARYVSKELGTTITYIEELDPPGRIF